ncbi:MAG: N-acetylglucosamine-6-phosphate deacetylase [Lachnospiraceae bacterium]|nr:N-acetylglucosamine-6-phosphate deacetylase [Lachnospiraceae bacterium]
MQYTNARIFTPEGFLFGSFRVEEGRFTEIVPEAAEGIDLAGKTVIPGLIDIHTHGNSGADFSDGSADGLRAMAAYLAKHGVTSFVPTSMTFPYDVLDQAFQTAATLHESRPEGCARVVGIHMEGPFFSEKKKGAQNAAFLKAPDYAAFLKLYESCKGLIKIVDIAPELPGAAEFTKKAAALSVVSVAHTDADYNDAAAVFDAGARHLTHLYNAMPPLLHRAPGVIGAASERENVTAELISDGLHVHPSAVRAAFRLFPGRICLISDAARCCGMPDGEYSLGGQKVFLKEGAARLSDGTLAGSAANLFGCLVNAIRFGIPEDEAIRAATCTPAKEIGAESEIGSIAPGKRADFAVVSSDWTLEQVFIDGQPVYHLE